MRRALDMFVIEGIHTTISLHKRILSDRTLSPDGSIPRFYPN